VFWAESFANLGFPSLRLDLPGLGDSGGAIPNELLNFINAGEYAAIAAAKIRELVERFGFSGVVLLGHCAGTVTAIHAAAGCVSECKGLVLLDPYFHLPQAVRPMVRRGLSAWAMRSRFGGLISNIYDRVRDLRRVLRGNALPGNANKKLLACWKQLAATGIPILLFKAPARKAAGTKPRVGEFDYLNHVLQIAGPGSQVLIELVEQTDHSFANRVGRAAVAAMTGRWLQTFMPAGLSEETAVKTPLTPTRDDKNYDQYQLNCLRS
jgi:pimeloyl-ACP methyl ester carboxylesterase